MGRSRFESGRTQAILNYFFRCCRHFVQDNAFSKSATVSFHIQKGKGKGHPRTDHEGPEGEQRYSSTLYLTSALDGEGGWSEPRPGRFTPRRKSRYPLYRNAGWAPGPVWTGAENLASTGIRSPDRPARSYTD
jgi:hypothetical protein